VKANLEDTISILKKRIIRRGREMTEWLQSSLGFKKAKSERFNFLEEEVNDLKKDQSHLNFRPDGKIRRMKPTNQNNQKIKG
jgi:hypothetical protein